MATLVNEKTIEDIIESLEENNKLLALEKRWEENFPAISDYLNQDNFSLLIDEEKAYVSFIVAVIFLSWEEKFGKFDKDLKPKKLEKIEEENWEKLNNAKGKTFREKLDVFFDGYTQEELLAFIEDSIQDDEQQMVSGAARDIVFICAITILDTIIDREESNPFNKAW